MEQEVIELQINVAVGASSLEAQRQALERMQTERTRVVQIVSTFGPISRQNKDAKTESYTIRMLVERS